MILRFTVFGHPEPQGSTRAFIPKGWKRPIITSDNKDLKSWRQEVTRAAIESACGEIISKENSVTLLLEFFLSRPASKPKRITMPTVKPDVDKLCRGVFDSLKGVIYEDDSQVCRAIISKDYGSPERVEITVATLADGVQIAEKSRSETLALFA